MMSRSCRLLLLACSAVVALGCAQILGIEDVPSPADAGGPVDGGLPPFDASGCDACAAVIPPGWTPALASTASTTCPSGYGDLTLAKTDPTFASGACTCSASNLVPPSCTSGVVSMTLGCDGGTGATMLFAVDSGCATMGPVTLQGSELVKPLAPSGGSCTPVATADQGKLSTTPITTCAPTSCPADLCAGTPPAGFSACVEQVGDVGCPSGFPNKRIVADAFQVDCSQACTTCAASATCSGGVLSLYDTCGGGLVTAIVADGTCRPGQPPASVAAATYNANNQGATYTADGPKTVTATPVNGRTLCCR